jgi:predicted MFS family arabinose efflux permease
MKKSKGLNPLHASLREVSRRRLFGSLCSIVLLVNLARVVFAPLLEPIGAAFGASATGVGLLATLAWLGSASPRLPTGYLLTRVPRHLVILAAGTMLSFSPLLAATAPSLAVLWASAFLMGLSSGMYFIAVKPLLSDLFPTRIGSAVGVHGTASQLAAAGAPLFVTLILLVSEWRTVFFLLSGAAAAATVAFFLIARSSTVPDGETESRDFLGAVRRQWKLVVGAIALAGFADLAWNGVFNFYVSYLISEKAISEGTARALLSVVFAAGVPAFVLAGRLADRVPYVPLVLAIITGFAASLLGLTMVSGVAQLAALSVTLGLAIHSLFPAMDTYVLDSLPDAHRASAYAVFSAAIITMSALGSVVVGVLLDAGFAYTTIFQGFATVALAFVVVFAGIQFTVGFPTGRHPTEHPEARSSTTD